MTEQTYRGGCEVFTKTELKSLGRFRCILNAPTSAAAPASETTGTLLDVGQQIALKLRRGRAEFMMRLDDGREVIFRIRRPAPGNGLEFILSPASTNGASAV
jgi:hypothetical protein